MLLAALVFGSLTLCGWGSKDSLNRGTIFALTVAIFPGLMGWGIFAVPLVCDWKPEPWIEVLTLVFYALVAVYVLGSLEHIESSLKHLFPALSESEFKGAMNLLMVINLPILYAPFVAFSLLGL